MKCLHVVVPVIAIAVLLTSCGAPAQSRFPPDVATALREQPMRRLETDSLIVYYPTKRRPDAVRIATRLEACAAVLRGQAKIHNSYADQKMSIVIPDVSFNNAFVALPAVGNEPVALIPTSNTLDFVSELGMPPDPSFIGCHELVHYVQVLQTSGLWGWVNRIFGDVLTPQIGLDSWFLEGLATYYESRLSPGTGRMAWPAWRGVFHAGFAGKRINGGDLSAFQRPYHWGNHYLVGSHFVEFLAQRYGEEALWKLIDIQGDSILFPLGVALRWKAATGKSLPTLIDEFADAVEKHYPKRDKPASQHRVRSAGSAARYAMSTTGREAIIQASGDMSPQLRIYDHGKLLRERDLINILPPRTLVAAHPILTSGLSFTGDGEDLYFVVIDTGSTFQEERLLRYRIASDSLEVVEPRLHGTGGGVSADGKTFYYGYANGDRRDLAALDVASGNARILRQAAPQTYYDHARPSPNGERVASAVFNGKRFVIQILSASSGRTEIEIPFAGAIHDPSWIDDGRLLLLAEHEGRFQVHIYDLESGALERVSDAPYLAFQPRSDGKTIRFLNRQGWSFSLDEIPLPAKRDSEVAALTPPVAHVESLAVDAPTTSELHVLSDESYSQLDSLFFPRLRTPALFSAGPNASLIGLQLTGGDPLAFHRWSVFGQYDLTGGHVSGGAQYVNALLAPLELRVDIQHFAWNEAVLNADNMPKKGPFRTESQGRLAIGRSLRTSRVDFAAQVLQQEDPENSFVPFRVRRLAGPSLSLQHNALRSTPYAGFLQGYGVSADAAYYNKSMSSFDFDLVDLRGQLELRTPLPLSKRHTLGLSLRGHRLVGPDRDQSFLVVGGSDAIGELWQRSDTEKPMKVDLPAPSPLLAFREPLRGFENLEFATDRIAIADLTYRLPIILDFGFASTAYILPSWYFSQLNLQLFAAGATDSFASFESHNHLAVGASAALAMSVWLLPVQLRYQLARRMTDDEALVHLLTIGI